jgi:hypothetical protein
MPAPLTAPAPGDYPPEAWARLGAGLKAWRKARLGITTIAQFTSDAGGISRSVVSDIERGFIRVYDNRTWARLTDQYELARGSMEDYLAGAAELQPAPRQRYRPASLKEIDAALDTLQRVRNMITGEGQPVTELEDRRRAAG